MPNNTDIEEDEKARQAHARSARFRALFETLRQLHGHSADSAAEVLARRLGVTPNLIYIWLSAKPRTTPKDIYLDAIEYELRIQPLPDEATARKLYGSV